MRFRSILLSLFSITFYEYVLYSTEQYSTETVLYRDKLFLVLFKYSAVGGAGWIHTNRRTQIRMKHFNAKWINFVKHWIGLSATQRCAFRAMRSGFWHHSDRSASPRVISTSARRCHSDRVATHKHFLIIPKRGVLFTWKKFRALFGWFICTVGQTIVEVYPVLLTFFYLYKFILSYWHFLFISK